MVTLHRVLPRASPAHQPATKSHADKIAEITLRNAAINRARDTFFNGPSNTLPNALATLPQAAIPLKNHETVDSLLTI